MYDTTKVLIGLGLFAVVFGYPFLNNLGSDYEPPALAKAKQEPCIEDTEWMRANHMSLLDDWRHAVSRDGLRMYTSFTTGKEYVASLQRTCMECHGTYDQFCKKCHDDNSVSVYCWDCHVTPESAGLAEGVTVPAPEEQHGHDEHDMGHGQDSHDSHGSKEAHSHE